MKTIEDYENHLYDLYDNGVSIRSQYFIRELNIFIKEIKNLCTTVDINVLKLLILEEKGLNKEETRLLNHIAENGFIVKCSKKQLCQCMNNCSDWILIIRLSMLEASNIIKTQEYGRIRIIYLHPTLIEKWNRRQNS